MTADKICVAGGALMGQLASREHLLVTVRETQNMGSHGVRAFTNGWLKMFETSIRRVQHLTDTHQKELIE